jgi:hypothetical protein
MAQQTRSQKNTLSVVIQNFLYVFREGKGLLYLTSKYKYSCYMIERLLASFCYNWECCQNANASRIGLDADAQLWRIPRYPQS